MAEVEREQELLMDKTNVGVEFGKCSLYVCKDRKELSCHYYHSSGSNLGVKIFREWKDVTKGDYK